MQLKQEKLNVYVEDLVISQCEFLLEKEFKLFLKKNDYSLFKYKYDYSSYREYTYLESFVKDHIKEKDNVKKTQEKY